MASTRLAKLEEKLGAAEDALRTRLLAVLPRVEGTGEMLFLNAKNMPGDYRSNWLPEESDELHDLAAQCVSLREQCALNDDLSIGNLFLAACREAADIENEHRRGPRRLAAWLLTEMRRLSMNDSH